MAKELRKTRKELLAAMDSREFTEWQCYFEVLKEKEEEAMEQRKKEEENNKQRLMEGQITQGVMTAGAYSKAKKR